MPDRALEYRIGIGDDFLSNDALEGMSRLSFEEKFSESSHFEFTISETTNSKLDPEMFKVEQWVTLSMGYHSDTEHMFEGEIVSVSPVFPQDGASKLKILASDNSYKLKKEHGPRILKATNVAVLAKGILAGGNFSANFQPESKLSSFALGDDQSYEQKTKDTDWKLLLQLADLVGFRLFLRGDIVHMVNDDYLRSVQRERTTFSYPAGDSSTVPLLSFEPEVSSKDQRTQVKVIGWASKGADGEISGTVKLSELGSEGESYTELRVQTEKIETLFIKGENIKTIEQARTLARGTLEERSRRLVQGEAQIVGNPRIRMGQFHEIQLNDLGGFGPKYSGEYLITGTRHVISRQGYATLFDVTRRGLNKQ